MSIPFQTFNPFWACSRESLAACIAAGLLSLPCFAQTAPQAMASGQPATLQVIPLEEAIRLAQANEPNFATASAEAKATALDRSISRAALLPNAVYHNQFLYTQGNGIGTTRAADGTVTPAPPIFIANNAVHEYMSQAAVTETIGLKGIADVRLANATAARAAAEYEVARRGLVATVVGLYYSLTASEHKVAVAERAENEAAGFTDLTNKRENAREVAHADVVKAELQQ